MPFAPDEPRKGGQSVPFPATGMPDRDWWGALWLDPEGVLRKLDVSSGMSVVDLGCGDGYFTAPLSRIAAPGRVYALDLDPEMLDRATEEVVHRGKAENCAFVLADARDVAKRIPALVDLVLLANTFHGVPDKTHLARAVHAALRPSGRFAVVNWYPIPRDRTPVLGIRRGPATKMRISPEQTRAVVEPSGFDLERVVELPPYHYGMIFVRKG